ncbi:MAG TPA: BspA family leucine-rich repeat surface protein [Tissierellaceae bacterium]|nr:BspA family leucine-rich repeat surface protein [Tissierellaceae bacterium]
MIADRVRMRKKKSIPSIPDYYVMATDADFSGTADGDFVYIGSDEYVAIPHKIKGVTVTKTYNSSSIGGMFGVNASIVKGVATLEGHSITNMSNMFYLSKATTLDLSSFDTSNVTNMGRMFTLTQATTLDLSSFDTSKVTNMDYMFYGYQATTLDLSSFNTSNVTNMSGMFQNSQTRTGYARTQADANKFNATSNKPAGLNFVVK